jgi:hypothetical protein
MVSTNDLINSTEIINKIYLEKSQDAMAFIGHTIDKRASQEDVEDIFVESISRLWEQVLSKVNFYSYESAQKILYGMIKKKLLIFRNESANTISIEFLEEQHSSSEDFMYDIEDDISDVPLYTPNEIFLREREKTPERRNHHRLKAARQYQKVKSDPILWRAYLDKQNALRRVRRAKKKNGTFVDKRLLQNKNVKY